MTRTTAAVLVVVALVAGGLWLAYGDGLARGPAEATPAPATAELAALPGTEGWTPVAPLADEPVRRFDGPEEVLDPTLDYRAAIETTAGELVVDLYDDRAPRTVNNFVFLALHRYYDGVPFHRVLDDFMAQTGDPTGTGTGGPGYTFEDEIVPGLVHDRPGLLSMANAGPDTNGSQFFVTFAATPWLDGAHAVFGGVVEGMETLDAITRIDPQRPTAVARLSEPASALAEAGVDAAADATGTVETWLREALGTLPAPGQSFVLDGRLGVAATAGGAPAVGFFPVPDRIERVTILAAPEEGPADVDAPAEEEASP